MKTGLVNKFVIPGLTGLTLGLLIAILLHALGEITPKSPGPVSVKGDEPDASDRHDYVGEVKNGLYHGHGTLTFDYGDKYVGEFKDGEFHGNGTYTWARRGEYTGEWEDGEANGYGVRTYTDGHREKYVGEWKDDERHGHGALTYADGTIVKREWAYGMHYDPVTGEYTCENHPEVTKTGNLSIELYQEYEQYEPKTEQGGPSGITQCNLIGYVGFAVYRDGSKLLQVDESQYVHETGHFYRLDADYPRHPEDFPLEVDEEGRLIWRVGETVSAPVPPGYDITGDGSPNLLIGGYTGGAHCCYSYYLLDIGENPDLIGLLHTEHSGITPYQAPNTSGVTLLVHDWTYAYWHTCFACSPAPDVFLSFDQEKGWFVPNTEMMKTDVPPRDTLDDWVEEIQQYWDDQPQLLWTYMLDLIYTGNLGAAKKLMDRAWPSEGTMEIPPMDETFIEHVFYKTELHPTSKVEFWHGLLDKIEESEFAEEIFLMNATDLCSVGPLFSLPFLERELCREG